MPDIDESFPHTWRAQRLAGRPLIAPARHITLPRPVPGEEDTLARGALELLVSPASQPQFLATCALGFADPTLPTGVWSCPHPDHLCAVAGGYAYLVPTAAPNPQLNSTHLPLRPVTAVLPAVAAGLLLFAGFHGIVAWGTEGIAWQSARLSWEGLTDLRVDGLHLHGQGWDMLSDRDLPFTLDLQTGTHTGGAFHF